MLDSGSGGGFVVISFSINGCAVGVGSLVTLRRKIVTIAIGRVGQFETRFAAKSGRKMVSVDTNHRRRGGAIGVDYFGAGNHACGSGIPSKAVEHDIDVTISINADPAGSAGLHGRTIKSNVPNHLLLLLAGTRWPLRDDDRSRIRGHRERPD